MSRLIFRKLDINTLIGNFIGMLEKSEILKWIKNFIKYYGVLVKV